MQSLKKTEEERRKKKEKEKNPEICRYLWYNEYFASKKNRLEKQQLRTCLNQLEKDRLSYMKKLQNEALDILDEHKKCIKSTGLIANNYDLIAKSRNKRSVDAFYRYYSIGPYDDERSAMPKEQLIKTLNKSMVHKRPTSSNQQDKMSTKIENDEKKKQRNRSLIQEKGKAQNNKSPNRQMSAKGERKTKIKANKENNLNSSKTSNGILQIIIDEKSKKREKNKKNEKEKVEKEVRIKKAETTLNSEDEFEKIVRTVDHDGDSVSDDDDDIFSYSESSSSKKYEMRSVSVPLSRLLIRNKFSESKPQKTVKSATPASRKINQALHNNISSERNANSAQHRQSITALERLLPKRRLSKSALKNTEEVIATLHQFPTEAFEREYLKQMELKSKITAIKQKPEVVKFKLSRDSIFAKRFHQFNSAKECGRAVNYDQKDCFIPIFALTRHQIDKEKNRIIDIVDMEKSKMRHKMIKNSNDLNLKVEKFIKSLSKEQK